MDGERSLLSRRAEFLLFFCVYRQRYSSKANHAEMVKLKLTTSALDLALAATYTAYRDRDKRYGM